jgi:hypothetical protein
MGDFQGGVTRSAPGLNDQLQGKQRRQGQQREDQEQ